MERNPIVVFIVPYALGIALAYWWGAFSLSVVVVWIVVSVLAWIWAAVLKRQRIGVYSFGIAFTLTTLLLGYGGAWLRLPENQKTHYSHYAIIDGPSHMIELRLQGRLVPTAKSNKVEAKVLGVGTMEDDSLQWHSCSGRLMVFIKDPEGLSCGDTLMVYARLQTPFQSNDFNYRRYLYRKDILAVSFLSADDVIAVRPTQSGLRPFFERYRSRLVAVIERSGMTAEHCATTEALLLGYRDNLDNTTWSLYRNTGIAHLLSVSGLHVGIVAAFVAFLLKFLGNSPRMRRLRGCLQLAAVWLFVALTGMGAAAMRAGLMLSFMTVGSLWVQRPRTLNAIAASALVLLMIRPGMLFDVGFHLSYAAVLGIVLLYRPLSDMLKIKNRPLRWAWNSAVLSTSAQFATLPLTLYYFHQFPTYYLIANLVVVPVVGLLMGTGVLLLLVGGMPHVLYVFGMVLGAMLSVTDWVLNFITQLPGAVIAF